MDRYAHVNGSGDVVNICLWDGETEYNPSGVILIKDDGNARMGGRWDGNSFEYDEPVEPERTAEQLAHAENKLSAKSKLAALGLSEQELSAAFGI
jgi:hypothetical protein